MRSHGNVHCPAVPQTACGRCQMIAGNDNLVVQRYQSRHGGGAHGVQDPSLEATWPSRRPNKRGRFAQMKSNHAVANALCHQQKYRPLRSNWLRSGGLILALNSLEISARTNSKKDHVENRHFCRFLPSMAARGVQQVFRPQYPPQRSKLTYTIQTVEAERQFRKVSRARLCAKR